VSHLGPAGFCGSTAPYSSMQSELVEKALLVITSEQTLVNIISRRVRQLTTGRRPMIDPGPRMGFADIALTEVIEGKLHFEATQGYTAEPIASRRLLAPDQTDGMRSA
jgi:DNA-directed RNA polymerase subunit K/omega